MRAQSWTEKAYYIAIVIIIAAIAYNPVWPQEPEQKNPSFEELIEKASVRLQGPFSRGFLNNYFRPGIKGPGPFEPVKGLDDVNAVSFLIDVLEKGTWIKDNKESTGFVTHVGRCYAALCLGYIGDERAFKPLVEILKNGTYLKEAYRKSDQRGYFKISDYAAFALGLLSDPRAVEPLLQAMKKNNSEATIYGLGGLGDIRAFKPVLDFLLERGKISYVGSSCLQRLSRVSLNTRYSELDAFGLGSKGPSLSGVKFWQIWWEHKDEIAKIIFEKNYSRWEEFQKLGNNMITTTNDKMGATIASMKKDMTQGGIPTLPYLIEAIEKGDESLIPLVAELTANRGKGKSTGLSNTATKEETLEWWLKNKDQWTLKDADKESIPTDLLKGE